MLMSASVCIPFYWWVVFQCMDIPQFICSSGDRHLDYFQFGLLLMKQLWTFDSSLFVVFKKLPKNFLKQLSIYSHYTTFWNILCYSFYYWLCFPPFLLGSWFFIGCQACLIYLWGAFVFLKIFLGFILDYSYF